MKSFKNIALTFFLVCGLLIANAQTVYKTESGKKYHKKNCKLVNEGKKGLELKDAKKQGLEPCAICYPVKK